MASTERVAQKATHRARRAILTFGAECREARLTAGFSQAHVAQAAGLSRPRYTKIEAGRVETLQLVEAARIAAVVGLDLVVRTFPGGEPLRDQAQARRLGMLLAKVGSPLQGRREVALPARDGVVEQRAWDAVLTGHGERTAIELETRLRDAQALERRLALKLRDDPPDRFLLVLANTATNRRIVRENPGVFADLPRLRRSRVLADLANGRHPPPGLVLI